MGSRSGDVEAAVCSFRGSVDASDAAGCSDSSIYAIRSESSEQIGGRMARFRWLSRFSRRGTLNSLSGGG
jgi:hypothetical protein